MENLEEKFCSLKGLFEEITENELLEVNGCCGGGARIVGGYDHGQGGCGDSWLGSPMAGKS